MIYFLVNNNYHFLDVLSHCKELDECEKSLIQVPHTLDVLESHPDFAQVYTFISPFNDLKSYLNIFHVKKVEKTINTCLPLSENDVLFVYTEFEILNQYIMHQFKKAGAKVYIIEDGGLPTYLTYTVKSDRKLPLKQLLKLAYLRHLLGYEYLEYLYYNDMVFPQMDEKYIDGVLLYIDVNIRRNIKKLLIGKSIEKVVLDDDTAMVLNEKLYTMYCAPDEYKAILDDLLAKLSDSFEKIYFKFHPRETSEDRKWQLEIIKKHEKIVVIDNNAPIEQLLGEYNAKYVFSFISAALLNLLPYGAIPVYVFQLFDVLKENPIFLKTESLLNAMGYTFLAREGFDAQAQNVGFPNNITDGNNIKINDLVDGNIT